MEDRDWYKRVGTVYNDRGARIGTIHSNQPSCLAMVVVIIAILGAISWGISRLIATYLPYIEAGLIIAVVSIFLVSFGRGLLQAIHKGTFLRSLAFTLVGVCGLAFGELVIALLVRVDNSLATVALFLLLALLFVGGYTIGTWTKQAMLAGVAGLVGTISAIYLGLLILTHSFLQYFHDPSVIVPALISWLLCYCGGSIANKR
jgi:hypothetical protein